MDLAALSFRDPAGACFELDHRILRLVKPEGLDDLEAFLNSAAAEQFKAREQIVATTKLGSQDVDSLRRQPGLGPWISEQEEIHLFEHERIFFPSFPYEWPPEMLWTAGMLTLDLAQQCLEEDFGLKDATPYNVLFSGARPVFIDVLSFERRVPGDAVWKPYAQFVRTFVLPLLVNRHWGIPLADIFITHRDGLETEAVHRMCGFSRKFRPPFFTLVTLPTWLSAKPENPAIYHPLPLADSAKARFIVQSLLRRLRRTMEKIGPRKKKRSTWSHYMESHSYTEADFSAKRDFVVAALEECQPRRVLDVGANTGYFSELAAKRAAKVVAIDSDAACMGQLWRKARDARSDILPLVIDLARPSPGIGWRNRENRGFLQRAAGRFDMVFMLAVLHHLLVTERVPLPDVMELAAELTTAWLVIEFVAPADEMFRRLLRGREHLFEDLTVASFETACQRRFAIVRSVSVRDTHRRLYLLRRK